MMWTLSQMFESDPLTGLSDRRALNRLQHDTYGHEVGDEVLRKVAQVSKANTREVIIRVGCEEIAVARHRVESAPAMRACEIVASQM